MCNRVEIDDFGSMIVARCGDRVIEGVRDLEGKWRLFNPRYPSTPVLIGMTKRQAKKAAKEHFQEVE